MSTDKPKRRASAADRRTAILIAGDIADKVEREFKRALTDGNDPAILKPLKRELRSMIQDMDLEAIVNEVEADSGHAPVVGDFDGREEAEA